jgi:hypothetical protein
MVLKITKINEENFKKINSIFSRKCLHCTNIIKRHLCISILWKDSFHFMTQKYQNFRVKRTGPKIPTLPAFITHEYMILKKKHFPIARCFDNKCC